MNEIIYNNEERIDRYLHGEMTREEELLFEEDLSKDDNLRQQAETIARMAKSMKVVGSDQDRTFIEQMKDSAGTKLAPVWWLSIAASILIIFTIGYHFYDHYQTVSLGRQYAYVFSTETESLIRGEENEDVANQLTVLFDNAANGKDLDNTIKQLEELWKLSQSDVYNEYTNYAPIIGWNLAIAYLQNNDKKGAVAILTQMQSHYPEETIIGKFVLELLEKL